MRWLILFFIIQDGRNHIPSLILASILFTVGVITSMMAVIADLISVNRKILEELQYKARQQDFNKKK